MKKAFSLIALMLLLNIPVSAQNPLALIPDGQPTPSTVPETQALGEIVLAPAGEDTVVIIVDQQETLQDNVGFADLIVVFKTSSSVINLPTVRDVGLLTIEKHGVVVNFPGQQLQYDFTLLDEREVPAGATLIHGTTLATWIPEAGQELTVDDALAFEQARHAEIQSISFGLLQQTDDHGGSGGCAASMSVTCHDGSSASASCPAGMCADCSCPNAGCGCFNEP